MPPLPPLEAIVLIGLAAFRATWLMTQDSVTAPWRRALEDWAWDTEAPNVDQAKGAYVPRPKGPVRVWVCELLTCNWCLGLWLSAGAYCTWRWAGSVVLAVLAVFAVAAVQGALAQFVVTLHEETED